MGVKASLHVLGGSVPLSMTWPVLAPATRGFDLTRGNCPSRPRLAFLLLLLLLRTSHTNIKAIANLHITLLESVTRLIVT
jgi:hypothetical protein